LQAITGTVVLWTLIPSAGSLIAIALAMVGYLIVAVAWLTANYRALVRPLWLSVATPAEVSSADNIILRAHNRTATAWVVGFLGPQLVSPIVFRFQGAAGAGHVGLSLAAASAALMISLSWLQARYPEYGNLVARNELNLLDAIAYRATAQAIAVCCACIGGLLAFVLTLQFVSPSLASRFLPVTGVAALCLTSLVYLVYQALAARLRAHREESLLGAILVGTVATIAATYVGAHHSALAAALSYSAASVLVLLPASILMFRRRHRALHRLRNAIGQQAPSASA
jgi:hypothetical protein